MTVPQLHDALNIWQKLTIYRLWNAAKILLSERISVWTGRARHFGFPMSAAVEPGTACNLRCPECPSGLRNFSRPTGMLQDEIFRKFIDSEHKNLINLTLYFQGEPYLHPDFTGLVKYATEKKIYVTTSTNGHYLTEKNIRKTIAAGLDRLIISVDGTEQETYEKYRIGGNLEKVLAGSRLLSKIKKETGSRKPYTVFQFLAVRHNEHQIPEVHRLARECGIDEVKIKTAQIYDYKNGSPLLPENPKYSRYRQKSDGLWEIKNPLKDECRRMWSSCVMTWDGKVAPCCFDKDAANSPGSIADRSFREIWEGENYRRFRQQILDKRSAIDICTNCTEGADVWA